MFETLMEFLDNDDNDIVQIFLAATVVLLITFLIIRYFFRKMNDHKGRPWVNSDPSDSFKKNEIGTEQDLQPEKSSVASPTQNTELPPSVPTELVAVAAIASSLEPPKQTIALDKFEPGIIFYYKTEKSKTKSVQQNVVNTLIKDKIDKLDVPNGTIGTPYEILIDLSSKDLLDVVGNVVLDKVYVTPALSDIGLNAESIPPVPPEQAGMKIKLWGTPKREFNAQLFFYVDFNRSQLSSEPQNKQESASFMDLSQIYVHTKPFIINAHPRDLWNDFPVDWKKEGCYENCDKEPLGETVDYAGGTTGTEQLEIIAASVRGRSHAHIGKPRDDAFHFESDSETGWHYIAVADGAGSAKYSRKGSELACQTVIETLKKHLTLEFNERRFKQKGWIQNMRTSQGIPDPADVESSELGKIFHRAIWTTWTAINEESQKREEAKLSDYNTTLLCAAFKYLDDLKTWIIVSYWIGDGGAVILRPQNSAAPQDFRQVYVLGEPDGGEFAGQTRFLTMKEEIEEKKIHNRLRFSFCDSFEAIVLVTDGITDPFFPSESAVLDERRWLEFYEKKLRKGCEEEQNGCPVLFETQTNAGKTAQEKAEALLQWLHFWSKGNHDDRTMLIVKPK